MSQTSNHLVLGLGLAGLILECFLSHPALATDKVSLFKIVTTRDEIIIGLSDDELSRIEGRDAGGIARRLATEGTMTVWQYAARKVEAGALEQAPLRRIGLLSTNALRVEPYTSPLKIVPITDHATRH